MSKWSIRLKVLSLVLVVLLAACASPTTPAPTPTQPAPTSAVVATSPAVATSPVLAATATPLAAAPTAQATSALSQTTTGAALAAGPQWVTGVFTYSNDIITTYYVEQAVALLDMYGFVTRNKDWVLPVDSQVLGYLNLDTVNKKGTYELNLPARPRGENSPVNHGGGADEDIQVFAIGYSPNLTGGPFSEGDDASRGWPNYLASVRTDPANNDEVIGGKLIVWTDKAGQQFPTGFGADGKLFTADDPLGTLPVGYSIVNLDTTPFAFTQEAQPNLTLYEPTDVAIKDYSTLSYTDAFEQLFKQVATRWAFNGIASKPIDWQAIHGQIAPMVAAAQQAHDSLGFYRAIKAFAQSIPDGHTGLSGGDPTGQDSQAHTGSGYGLALRETDSGSVIAVEVTAGGPADAAGIKVGAEVTTFAGQPISQAISAVVPYSGPFSVEASRRYQQVRYLTRAPLGTQAKVTFTNPGGQPQMATLTAAAETQSFSFTSIYEGYDPNALPVDAKILPSGIGYIKIDSNDQDLQLTIRLFQRALTTFKNNQVPGVVIDLRQNPGGAPLGLAGFLTDQVITEGQLEYYSDETGKFQPSGTPERIYTDTEQYRFDKLAVLVGQACASACELEAYGFSKVPGAMVVGMYPTAGVEAEVARGQYVLPEGITFQSPTGRFVNPDGSLFLEGTGVQPTLRVPINPTTLLATDDEELRYAEDAILGTGGGTPAVPGGPVLASASASTTLLSGGAKLLENVAAEHYTDAQLNQAGRTNTYTIKLTQDQRLIWIYGWCADTQAHLDDNLKSIQESFSVNGQAIDSSQFAAFNGQTNGQFCDYHYVAVSQWPSGTTRLSTQVKFTQAINDGTTTFPAGTRTLVYLVTAP